MNLAKKTRIEYSIAGFSLLGRIFYHNVSLLEGAAKCPLKAASPPMTLADATFEDSNSGPK